MTDLADGDPGRKPRFVVPPGSQGGIVLGPVVLAAGLAILWFAGRLLAETAGLPWERDEGGFVLLLVFATVILAFGAGILSWGLGPRIRGLRRWMRPAWGGDVPWAAHPWDLRGARVTRWGRGLAGALCALCTVGILFALGWYVLTVPGSKDRFLVALIALVLALGVLVLSWLGLRLLGDALKWGTSRLLFLRFPFELGGTADVRLPDVDSLFGFTRLEAVLRCVREEITGEGASRELRVTVPSEQRRTLEPRDVPIGNGDPAGVFALVRRVDAETFLDLSFPLPGGDLGSVFTNRFARYWELEITADTPGIPFRAAFLLPVSPAAPAPGRDEPAPQAFASAPSSA